MLFTNLADLAVDFCEFAPVLSVLLVDCRAFIIDKAELLSYG